MSSPDAQQTITDRAVDAFEDIVKAIMARDRDALHAATRLLDGVLSDLEELEEMVA